VVECLPSKCEALSSNLNTTKRKRKKEKKEGRKERKRGGGWGGRFRDEVGDEIRDQHRDGGRGGKWGWIHLERSNLFRDHLISASGMYSPEVTLSFPCSWVCPIHLRSIVASLFRKPPPVVTKARHTQFKMLNNFPDTCQSLLLQKAMGSQQGWCQTYRPLSFPSLCQGRRFSRSGPQFH
jgi:hypothetical protein